ncbi:hypothetical protein D920_01240 [Enterococcus faecalis 13-SD-W-01]|nr:hypothetical protein D920_01240 [Enterococcus faecalis 13-SD-W-01]
MFSEQQLFIFDKKTERIKRLVFSYVSESLQQKNRLVLSSRSNDLF